MKKIGISEPEIFVKNLFENQNIKYLFSSCFAPYYLNNLEEDIEELLNKRGFCDLQVLKLMFIITRVFFGSNF